MPGGARVWHYPQKVFDIQKIQLKPGRELGGKAR